MDLDGKSSTLFPPDRATSGLTHIELPTTSTNCVFLALQLLHDGDNCENEYAFEGCGCFCRAQSMSACNSGPSIASKITQDYAFELPDEDFHDFSRM